MKRISSTPAIVGVLVLLGIVAGLLLYHYNGTPAVVKDSGSNLSDYSAVFVQGGGIYFGKITSLTSEVLALDNVYTYGVVPTGTNSSSSSSSGQTQPTLFDASKVGIAPASHYNINRSQVILWYSLPNDSQVVKTITSYQQSNH